MIKIESKPTIYKGVLFRSRLEVAWAKFFDERSIAWEYEKQSFDFGDGTGYLPDYWFPDLGVWGEVKPTVLDREALSKATKLVLKTGSSIVLLEGNPSPYAYRLISVNPNVGEEEGTVFGVFSFGTLVKRSFPKLTKGYTEPIVVGKGKTVTAVSSKKRVLAR